MPTLNKYNPTIEATYKIIESANIFSNNMMTLLFHSVEYNTINTRGRKCWEERIYIACWLGTKEYVIASTIHFPPQVTTISASNCRLTMQRAVKNKSIRPTFRLMNELKGIPSGCPGYECWVLVIANIIIYSNVLLDVVASWQRFIFALSAELRDSN